MVWSGYYYSQRKILIYSCAISLFQCYLSQEQGDGLEGLCHFNGMETSAIALTDKVILELDSQVLRLILLRLLTRVGLVRQNVLILSEVSLYVERSKNLKKNMLSPCKKNSPS